MSERRSKQLEEAVEKVEEFLGDAPSVVSGAEEEALTIERLAQMSADVAILMSFGRDSDHWDVSAACVHAFVVPGPGFRGMSEGRGGKFAQWLVERLPQEREGVNRDYAWENVTTSAVPSGRQSFRRTGCTDS